MKTEPGRNCWRIGKAEKAGLLIDGKAYFAHFRKAIITAQKRVLIAGWDIDSRIPLIRNGKDDGYPRKLGDFLLTVLKQNEQLHIYMLLWDFSMIYAFERDWTPVLNHANWRRHHRLHLVLDDTHQPGASHHQKIVTVDTSVAFTGGFDLSKWRWDTRQHLADDERRTDPSGKRYPPFHDAQAVFSGPVVGDFNDLYDQRWKNATGKSLPSFTPLKNDDTIDAAFEKVDFRDINVAVSRTWDVPGAARAIRECEQLHVDAIGSARELIYIENQFLSSSVIGEAVIRRLESEGCPQIVIVLPRRTADWLEQVTMDFLRERLLFLFEKADKHKRLRIYYPEIPESGKEVLSVHSKLFIIDDVFLKVGSSNLTNRSMALDSECDVSIAAEGAGNAQVRAQIRSVRQRLLSEHLGISEDEYAAAEKKTGTMIAAIESVNNGERRLSEIRHGTDEETLKNIEAITIVDPERPVEADQLIDHFIGDTGEPQRNSNIKKFVLILLGLVVVAVLWSFTPVGDWLDKEAIAEFFVADDRTFPAMGQLYFILVFIITAIFGLPVTVLVGSAGILYGPFLGSGLALAGSLLSATGSYLIGRRTGKHFIRNFAGEKINTISKRMSRRGIWAVTVIRMVPVAPFAVVNMLAGASHISLRDFTLGTLIGMLPGILLLTTFFGQLVRVIRNTTTTNILIFIAVMVMLLIFVFILFRYIYKKNRRQDRRPENE